MTRPQPDAARLRTAEPPRVRIQREGLCLGERLVPLRCGALHPFRLAPDAWRPALEGVRDLGLTAVEACVPWSVHEVARGDFDFGERDPRKDVRRFADLAHELGLMVVLRPGPLFGIELERLGLPARIASDSEHLARTRSGRAVMAVAPPRMCHVPSLGSRAFRQEARCWLEAIAGALASKAWPDGPIVLVQLDFAGALIARAAPNGADHHPDTIETYRSFLRRRHGTLARVCEAHGMTVERWADVAPPTRDRAGDVPALRARLDWIAFEEQLADDAFDACAEGLRAEPLGRLPLVRTRAPDAATLGAKTAGDARLVGFEYAHDGRTPASIKQRTLRLAGSTRHAFASRFDVGAPPWSAPRVDGETRSALLATCAWGLRAFSLSALFDHGRVIGALFDGHGRARQDTEAWRRMLAALDAIGHHRLHLRPRVAIQRPSEYARLSHATHGLGPVSPAWLDAMGLPPGAGSSQERFGFAEPVQIAWAAWVDRVARALGAAGVSFCYVDADATWDATTRPAALFVPSHEFADPQRWQQAHAFADAGGTVRWGPRHPLLDADLRGADFAALPGPALVLDDDGAAADAVADLVRTLDIREPFSVAPASMELSVHWNAHAPAAVFVMHPGDADAVAALRAATPTRLRDACSDERFEAMPVASVPMPARSSRLLVLEGADA